jgi:hypothetical protein
MNFDTPDLASPIERRKDLIVFHNVTASGLKGMDELGGMVVPSFAVTKDTIGGNEFGEITLLVRPETIDPKSKGNKIYSGDAWNPTFPDTRLKINKKVIDKTQDRIFALMRNPENADAAKVARGWNAKINITNTIEVSEGSITSEMLNAVEFNTLLLTFAVKTQAHLDDILNKFPASTYPMFAIDPTGLTETLTVPAGRNVYVKLSEGLQVKKHKDGFSIIFK